MRAIPHSRRGWTLLEMMVVVPLMALLLSASAVLMTSVLRSQGALMSEIQQQSARSRLALQFREDAHAATGVTVGSPQTCDFVLNEVDLVHYEIKAGSLHRELRLKEEILEQAAFSLDGVAASFVLDESGERPLVRLNLEAVPQEMKHSRNSRSSVVEAAVGIHSPLPAGRPKP